MSSSPRKRKFVLSETVSRPAVVEIGGVEYPLRSIDGLSVVDLKRLEQHGRTLADGDAKDADVLGESLSELVVLVLDAPAEVREKLTPRQKSQILDFFLQASDLKEIPKKKRTGTGSRN